MTHPSGPNRCFSCGQWPCACTGALARGHYGGSHPVASFHIGTGHVNYGSADKGPDPPPEDEPLTTPDLIEPVVGWRSWVLKANGDLMSANSHVAWRPGPNEAVCDSPYAASHEHPAPQENCACGFYAMHDFGGSKGEILGLVKAWGTIVLHPTGLRSQWAEIALLVVPDPLKDDPRVKRMREHYKVPCVSSIEEAKYRAEEHGRAVPEELRPEVEEAGGEGVLTTKQTARALQQRFGTAPYTTPAPGSGHGGLVNVSLGEGEQITPPKRPHRWAPGFFANLAAAALNWALWAFGSSWGLALAVVSSALAAFFLYCWIRPRIGCTLRHLTLNGDCGHWGLLELPFATREKYGREFESGDPCPRCGWKLR